MSDETKLTLDNKSTLKDIYLVSHQRAITGEFGAVRKSAGAASNLHVNNLIYYPFPAVYTFTSTGNYCNSECPQHNYVCTREPGHKGQHEAITTVEPFTAYCAPWGEPELYPYYVKPGQDEFALIPSVPPMCGSKLKWCITAIPPYSPNTWVCTREKGHDGPHQAHYSTNKPCPDVPPWNDAMSGVTMGIIIKDDN